MACQSGQHWSSSRAPPFCSPPPAEGGLDAGCQGCARSGSHGDRTAHPATLVSVARGCNRLRRPSPRSAPLPSGHGHLRPRAPAGPRDPRAPLAERAPLPPRGRHPAALGPGPLGQHPEAGRKRIRSPAGSGSELPTGAGDPRGPGGARQGAGKLEAPGRPPKPASPRWPAVVRGSRVSVLAPAAAVSDAWQVPVCGVHRGHAASQPSVPSSRSRHRIPKFPQVQRTD